METEKKKKKFASKLSVAQHTSAECRSVLKDRIPSYYFWYPLSFSVDSVLSPIMVNVFET